MVRICFILIVLFCAKPAFSQSGNKIEIDSSALLEGLKLEELAGSVYGKNVDSAIYYIKAAIPQFKKSKDWEKYTLMVITLGAVFKAENKFKQYYKYTSLAYEECEKLLGDKHPNFGMALNNLSTYYYIQGNYAKAIDLSRKSINIALKNETTNAKLARMYLNFAIHLNQAGEYKESHSFLNQVLKLYQSNENTSDFNLIETYSTIAWTYYLEDKFDLAEDYYHKSIQLINTFDLGKNLRSESKIKIRTYHGAAELAIEKLRYEEAASYINAALKVQENEYAFRTAYSYELRGRIFRLMGKPDKALKEFSKALDLAKQSKFKLPDIARKYLRIGEVYEDMNFRDSSLVNYQKALQVLAPKFKSNDISNNPIPSILYSKLDGLDILNGKGQALWRKYQSNNNIEILSQSRNAFKSAIGVIQEIRQKVLSFEAKNILSEKTVIIYEGALRTALENYKLSGNETILAEAFLLTESNKSQLLLESINEQSALGIKGLPDSLLQKDKDLKLEIAFYQKKLIETGESDNKVKDWKDQLFNLKNELQSLTDHFEQNYPRYYQLKYQNESLSIPALQKQLAQNNEALIEYFVGEEMIYAFVVWKDGLEVVELKDQQEVFSKIETLRKAISQVPEDDAVLQNYQDFSTSAHYLYQSILEPIISLMPQKIKSLKIIPDGEFNYIPFDALLVKAADPQVPYFSTDHLDYVLEEYIISYDYSATWMLKNRNRSTQKYDGDFIAYAPVFKKASGAVATRACVEGELYDLACSDKEVQAIQAIVGGDVRLGQSASKEAFEQEAARYRIIHMATHACADEANPLFNKIFLCDDYMSNADLYNTSLNAELVVLSACNTGSGKLVKGEGVLSLARGFVQAGCASSVVSRWSVDDCATSELMQNMYSELKAGRRKDVALRTAKLNYLNTAGQLESHPYFWSAFVGYGDMGEMELGGSLLNWQWVLMGGFLIIGLLFYLKRK